MKISAFCQAGICLMFLITSVLSVDLNMTLSVPSPIKVGVTKNLNVHCRFEGQARDIPLEFIKIKSKKPSGNTKQLAEIMDAGGSASIIDSDLRSRSVVSGALHSGPSASSFLLLQISNVSCVEATKYTCTSQYQNASGTQMLSAEVVVDGTSDPSDLELILDPIRVNYPKQTSVKIMCRGKIGKPVREWFWFKYDSASKLWEPITSNIVQIAAAQVSDCAFSRHSNYTFIVPDEEIHMFRCTAGHDVDHSLNVTINQEVSGADSTITSTCLVISTLLYTMAVLWNQGR